MRRIAMILWLTFAALTAAAQTEDATAAVDTTATAAAEAAVLTIGYLSYDAVLHEMAEYDSVEVRMAGLRQAYEREMKRVEDEFNQKYEAFLEGRAEYPRTILLKRQQELQDMMQHNITFRNQSRQELEQARREALAPLRARLNEAIAAVARERGLVLVVNTDADACPFIEPAVSQNIEAAVKERIAN